MHPPNGKTTRTKEVKFEGMGKGVCVHMTLGVAGTGETKWTLELTRHFEGGRTLVRREE